MDKQNYDEYQLSVRYKVSFQALMLTFALFLVNATILTGFQDGYMWASPLVQTVLIICVVTIFFVTATTLKGAYLSNKVKKPIYESIYFFGLSALFAITTFSNVISFSNGFSQDVAGAFIKDGMLTDRIAPFAMCVVFMYFGVLNLWAVKREKRQTKQSDEE